MKRRNKPYNSTEVKSKIYHDYSIKIRGIVYDISYCEDTKELNIRRDELQKA